MAQWEITNPLIIVFETPEGKMQTHLHPGEANDYRLFGLLIADVIRHTARCFDVEVEQVAEWVNKELANPTTPIEGGRTQ